VPLPRRTRSEDGGASSSNQAGTGDIIESQRGRPGSITRRQWAVGRKDLPTECGMETQAGRLVSSGQEWLKGHVWTEAANNWVRGVGEGGKDMSQLGSR